MEEPRAGQRHPPGAQPDHADKPVAEKMPALADQVMNPLPVNVADGAEEVLPEPAQRVAGVVGAKHFRGFHYDDGDAQGNREPRVQPESEAMMARAFFQLLQPF